ncbi:MAG: LamG-like jellyroll fold domain-containing protein [Phycisphaerales bacterium]
MKTIRMTAIVVLGIVLAGGPATLAEDPVHFNDAKLKAAVEQALGKTNPTPTDMLGLTSFSSGASGITDLTGLEYARNLDWLYLFDNQISDLTPLAELTNLETLYLFSNQISDVSPLAGLTKLARLNLEDNQISDLTPLAGLRDLTELSLQSNQISDIWPLTGLTNLDGLWLRGNPLHPDACTIYIPQMESHGTVVYHDACWVLVPNVVGMSLAEAERTIFHAGWSVSITYIPDPAPAGQVVGQKPEDRLVPPDAVCVEVIVSSGPGGPGGPDTGGLVAHWKLDETSGAMAGDSSDNKCNGMVSGGAVWQPAGGKVGGALQLDGVDDYVQLPIGSLISSLTDSTFAMWVNWSGVGGAWQRVFDFGGGTDTYMFVTPFSGDTGCLRFTITNSGAANEDQTSASQSLPTGWHHVAVTIDGANKTDVLYLDGRVVATKTAARYRPSSLGNTTQNWLGKSQFTWDPYFNGSLDDVRVYNCPLSESEILAVMGRSPIAGGPVAHWKLDETQGATAFDSTGAHNGTLTGGPAWQPTGGVFGGALSFDGIDDRVNCGTFNPSAATGKLSICLWAKWNGQPQYFQGLIAKRNVGGPADVMWSLEIEMNTGKLGFFHATSGWIGGGPVLPIGQWTHVGVACDGTTATMYIDGEPTGSGPFSLPSATQATVVFGASTPEGYNAFKGALDDIRLYDQPLSEAQIETVMTGWEAEPEPNESDLLAHWTFDETAGGVAADSAGPCDGFLLGEPIWQPTAGKVGGALKFDGQDDCVVTDFAVDPADGPFGVFAWVQSTARGRVIISQDGSAAGTDWLGTSSAGRLTSALCSPALTSSKVITDGQWHEVGLVWDGTSRTLYVDGTAVGTDKPAAPASSTGGLNIGAGKNLDGGAFWSGLIDDVRICDRAVEP